VQAFVVADNDAARIVVNASDLAGLATDADRVSYTDELPVLVGKLPIIWVDVPTTVETHLSWRYCGNLLAVKDLRPANFSRITV